MGILGVIGIIGIGIGGWYLCFSQGWIDTGFIILAGGWVLAGYLYEGR